MARRFRTYRFEYFPVSRPKDVKGGIKAQSKRGGFGETWWAKRWIHVLESFNIGARLGRGRSYARRGQVLDIAIDKGLVTAGVQGSRPKPYRVQIKVKPLGPPQWKKLAAALREQALFTAKLLAGEMPPDIEEAFKRAGLSLFPEKLKDLETECSCPDWSNPCKHIAAVYYLIGEEFDRDPFLIFKLRGASREELIALLGNAIPDAKSTRKCGGTPATELDDTSTTAPEPLPAGPAAFWNMGNLPEDFPGEALPPETTAALLRRLGGFPFWRGNQPLLTSLEPIYRDASGTGLAAVLGECKPPQSNA